MRWAHTFLAALLAVAGGQAAAQTQYYNLDAARPGRVEDAVPTPRNSLDIDPSSLAYERLTGGTNRFRAEPRISYGALPFTEFELRIPVVGVVPPHISGARSTTGLGGLGVGVLHAFNVETSSVPAVALSGEWLAPAGSLAGPVGSYSVRLLVTKTTSIGRWHVNVAGGTYSVRFAARAVADTNCSTLITVRLAGTPCSTLPPIIIDAPCSVTPGSVGFVGASRFCMPPAAQIESTTTSVNSPTSLTGRHWFGGVGYDRAFGLSSTMLTADLFAERFVGLYARPDVTAEAGFRRQLTPIVALDAGGSWRFAGVLHSFSFTIGASYELATRPLFRQ
jgi:hypothetical protein